MGNSLVQGAFALGVQEEEEGRRLNFQVRLYKQPTDEEKLLLPKEIGGVPVSYVVIGKVEPLG